MTIHYR